MGLGFRGTPGSAAAGMRETYGTEAMKDSIVRKAAGAIGAGMAKKHGAHLGKLMKKGIAKGMKKGKAINKSKAGGSTGKEARQEYKAAQRGEKAGKADAEKLWNEAQGATPTKEEFGVSVGSPSLKIQGNIGETYNTTTEETKDADTSGERPNITPPFAQKFQKDALGKVLQSPLKFQPSLGGVGMGGSFGKLNIPGM